MIEQQTLRKLSAAYTYERCTPLTKNSFELSMSTFHCVTADSLYVNVANANQQVIILNHEVIVNT